MPSTTVELWIEGSDAHLRIHTAAGATFEDVRCELIAMRDRLNAEIERGPESCPMALKSDYFSNIEGS